jgi:hypothetical protein
MTTGSAFRIHTAFHSIPRSPLVSRQLLYTVPGADTLGWMRLVSSCSQHFGVEAEKCTHPDEQHTYFPSEVSTPSCLFECTVDPVHLEPDNLDVVTNKLDPEMKPHAPEEAILSLELCELFTVSGERAPTQKPSSHSYPNAINAVCGNPLVYQVGAAERRRSLSMQSGRHIGSERLLIKA